jgi:tRNA(Leu) C34 or U34 (ribose-2'-O)-methylase TrmL
MSDNKVIIGLTNPKSVTNVGAVIRASGCYNADEIRYTGSRYDHAAKHQTDTKNAASTILLHKQESLLDNLDDDVAVVCVELVVGATPLPAFVHPDKAMYIFGPEDSTIRQAVIDRADAVVYIPTTGCMNMAATVNVLLYDRLAKNQQTVVGDDLIRQNRDRNNRVQVKKK